MSNPWHNNANIHNHLLSIWLIYRSPVYVGLQCTTCYILLNYLPYVLLSNLSSHRLQYNTCLSVFFALLRWFVVSWAVMKPWCFSEKATEIRSCPHLGRSHRTSINNSYLGHYEIWIMRLGMPDLVAEDGEKDNDLVNTFHLSSLLSGNFTKWVFEGKYGRKQLFGFNQSYTVEH